MVNLATLSSHPMFPCHNYNEKEYCKPKEGLCSKRYWCR
jgi:hypothetical protein